MSDLLFTLNAVLPIVLIVALGYVLKRIKLVTPGGAKEMNKLVFKVFLPCMLFMNIYGINDFGSIDFTFIIYVLAVVLLIFAAALLTVGLITPDNRRKGALMQAAFRSNYALIGIPLATSIFGAEGGALATLLSAFSIPLFNVLAVIALTVFAGGEKKRISVKKILIGIVKNPLIQSIALGGVALIIRAVLVHYGIEFRLSDIKPVYKILGQLSAVATPIALIVLGANFEFSSVPGMKKEIIAGVTARLLIAPIVGIGLALLLGIFDNAHYAVFVATFGTSMAVSTVPMAQEMDSDHELTGQLVIWTTLISAFSLFVFIYLLRVIGIF